MTIREYKVDDISQYTYFCPICHRRIELPIKGNIIAKNGINIRCGNCKKGQIKIFTNELAGVS